MKIKTYIPCVFVTLLLVFSLIGAVAAFTAAFALDEEKAVNIAEKNNLDVKVQGSLEGYFQSKYNATGIPANVYMKSLTAEWIDISIKGQIRNGFRYISKGGDSLYAPDYSNLDADISQFFHDYADQNGYDKDNAFSEKLKQSQDEAHGIIDSYTDVFKFRKLRDEGVLPQVRKIIDKVGVLPVIIAFIMLITVLSVFIVLICRSNKLSALYWIGIAFMISGVIGIVPGIYVKSAHAFDSFVIKQQQVFTAVTSYLYGLAGAFLVFSVSLAVIGSVLLVIFSIVLNRSIRQKNTV